MAAETGTHWLGAIQCHDLKTALALGSFHVNRGLDETHLGELHSIILKKSEILKREPELFQIAIEVLFRSGRHEETEPLVHELFYENAPYAQLKRAHIAMLKHDYATLESELLSVQKVPREYRDEYHFLHFALSEKKALQSKSKKHRQCIRSEYFQHRVRLFCYDHAIYAGHFKRTQESLRKTIQFFTSRHCPFESLSARSQLAKLWREQGAFTLAAKEYEDIFHQSNCRGFSVLAASIAVDLGNLFQENNDDENAAIWYQKAQAIFSAKNDQSGIILVKANLFEISINRGEWNEAELLLKEVIAYNTEHGATVSLAIDLFNRGWLGYLRRRMSSAKEYAERALDFFTQHNHKRGIDECLSLLAKIAFFEGLPIQIRRVNPRYANDSIKEIQLLLECQETQPEDLFLAKLSKISSQAKRFDVLSLISRRWKSPHLLNTAHQIAVMLSAHGRKRFLMECKALAYEITPPTSLSPEMRIELYEVLAFFIRNRRVIPQSLQLLRDKLEEEEEQEEQSPGCRLMSNSSVWNAPGEAFNSLLCEIKEIPCIQCLHMRVLTRQREIFSFSKLKLNSHISAKLQSLFKNKLSPRELSVEELEATMLQSEFQAFAHTKLFSVCWGISEETYGQMLIASSENSIPVRLFPRIQGLINRFSVLYARWNEMDPEISNKLDFIIGNSKVIRELKLRIAQVSKVDFSLLICGESGTGKELVARAVHILSSRANKPFVSVNAAAIPENLLEAELFGYRRGAFTGATENKMGLIESAEGGTLFLDEIADLPFPLQAKLLRALQEKEILRLGETRPIRIDIRLISATNRELTCLVKDNKFRSDLFYRLQDLTIRLPPLRERQEDIPLLIEHFLNKHGCSQQNPGILRSIASQLVIGRYEGNVRELESRVKQFITFGSNISIGVQKLQDRALCLKEARDSFERKYIKHVLNENNWVRSRAAEQLGISRMGLYQLIKKHKINVDLDQDC